MIHFYKHFDEDIKLFFIEKYFEKFSSKSSEGISMRKSKYFWLKCLWSYFNLLLLKDFFSCRVFDLDLFWVKVLFGFVCRGEIACLPWCYWKNCNKMREKKKFVIFVRKKKLKHDNKNNKMIDNMSLGIMGDPLMASLKPLWTLQQYCTEGFKGAF